MFGITLCCIFLGVLGLGVSGAILAGINKHFSIPDPLLEVNAGKKVPPASVPSPGAVKTDVIAASIRTTSTVQRLQTLYDHQRALRLALSQAQRRVIIVSPFLSAGAVRADRVDTLVRLATSRNVAVVIYIDRSLNVDKDGSELPQSREAREILTQAGARVVISNRIHSKTLLVDDDEITETSFNWLSALRDVNHRHQRVETGLTVRGPAAVDLVREGLKTLQLLAS